MSGHWNPLIFLKYNGSVLTHGLTTIGPITWSFDNGWNMVGMTKRSVLVTDIIETMLNSYRKWFDKQLMSVEVKITF